MGLMNYILPTVFLTALGFSQKIDNRVNIKTNTDSVYVSITQPKKIFYSKGDFFFKHEIYDSAATYYELENEIMLRDNKIDEYEERLYADNNLNLSKCNLEQGDLEKALKNINIAKEHAKKYNDKIMLSETYFNKHQIYKKQGKTDDAIKILGKAINTMEKIEFVFPEKELREIIPLLYEYIGESEKLKTYYKTMGDLLEDNKKILKLESGEERTGYDFYTLEFRLDEAIKRFKSLITRFNEEERLIRQFDKQKVEMEKNLDEDETK